MCTSLQHGQWWGRQSLQVRRGWILVEMAAGEVLEGMSEGNLALDGQKGILVCRRS